MSLRNRTAFTLVEMMVVVTIIAMLTALLLPALNPHANRPGRATCMNNQKNIATAILQYEGPSSSSRATSTC